MQDVDKMIADNLGLVYSQLKKFYLRNDQDAESFAYEALGKAATTYNKGCGTMFSTYATVCIYNALGCYVRYLHRKRQLDVISYNAIAYTDDNGLHEHVEFMSCPDQTEADYVRQELIRKTRDEIQYIIDNQTPNEKSKKIIVAYVENEYELSTIELARIGGVSQSYASQVVSVFKNKLRKRMEGYYHA